MLNRCDFKYNDVFVKVFEDWIGAFYPDDHYLFDKQLDSCGYGEYINPYVEEMFDMWLNVYYQLTHPKNQEITKNIKVEYIY